MPGNEPRTFCCPRSITPLPSRNNSGSRYFRSYYFSKWWQGDLIGEIFAYWIPFYFEQFFGKLQKQPKFLGYVFPKIYFCFFTLKNGLGYILGDLFRKLIRSPCKLTSNLFWLASPQKMAARLTPASSAARLTPASSAARLTPASAASPSSPLASRATRDTFWRLIQKNVCF
jgi:hypothetical protein